MIAAGVSVFLVVGTYRTFRNESQGKLGRLAGQLLAIIGLLVLEAMVLRKDIAQLASILRQH